MTIDDVYDRIIERNRGRHFSVTSDAAIWYEGNRMTSSISLTNKQVMDLQSAKKEIIARSKKEKGKKLYLNVDDEGEVNVSEEYIPNSSGFCFRNGSEIALPADSKKTPEPKTKSNKKTVETENSNVMETKSKKSAKKVARKTAKAEKAPRVEADAKGAKKQTLAIKEIVKLLRAGHLVFTTSGNLMHETSQAALSNQDREREVLVKRV